MHILNRNGNISSPEFIIAHVRKEMLLTFRFSIKDLDGWMSIATVLGKRKDSGRDFMHRITLFDCKG